MLHRVRKKGLRVAVEVPNTKAFFPDMVYYKYVSMFLYAIVGKTYKTKDGTFLKTKWNKFDCFLKIVFFTNFFSNLSFTISRLALIIPLFQTRSSNIGGKYFKYEEIKIFAFLKIFRKFVQKYFKINLVDFGDSSWKDQSFLLYCRLSTG